MTTPNTNPVVVKKPEDTVAAAPFVFKKENNADGAPANWRVTPDGDNFSFVNLITGRSVKATMAEFNAMLRG